MRDRNSVMRIGNTIEIVLNLMTNKYASKDVKIILKSFIDGKQLSPEEFDILSEIFGFKETDNSMYFSANNLNELCGALLLLNGEVPVGNNIPVRLKEIGSAVDSLEAHHNISKVTARFLKRIFELRYGMLYINYSTAMLQAKECDAEVLKQIKMMRSMNIISENSEHLLRIIYKVELRNIGVVGSWIKQSLRLPSNLGQVSVREIVVNGKSVYELFSEPDTLKLSTKYFENSEKTKYYSGRAIDSLIDVVRNHEEQAISCISKLIEGGAQAKGKPLFVSADFRDDAVLLVEDIQNRRKDYINLYTNDSGEFNGVIKDCIGTRKRCSVLYRSVRNGKVVFIPLQLKYGTLVTKLCKMRDNQKLSDAVEIYQFRDSTLPLRKELSSKQLSDRLSKFGVAYINNILENYEKHLKVVANFETAPDVLFIVEDFKLDAYVRDGYERLIKVFDSDGVQFTDEFREHIFRCGAELGKIVYKLPTKGSYVDLCNKYGRAIARIRLLLGAVGGTVGNYNIKNVNNDILSLYSQYGVATDYTEPSTQDIVELYRIYGSTFLNKLYTACKNEEAKLPASTFGDYKDVNILLSPFANEGFIEYRVETERTYDPCRGNGKVSRIKRVKLAKRKVTGDIGLTSEAESLLRKWESLTSPRIVFKATNNRHAVDIRGKYDNMLANVAYVKSKVLMGVQL